MTYEQYRSIFTIAAISCGILLAVTVFLFWFFKVGDIIKNLSGVAAQKAIRDIRERNQIGYDAGRYANPRTGSRSYSGRLGRRGYRPMLNTTTARPSTPVGAQSLSPGAAGNQTMPDPNATTILGTDKTTLLSFDETMVLNSDEAAPQEVNITTVLASNETTVLSAGETTVLAQDDSELPEQEQGEFKVLSELSYTQSEKIVE